LTYREGTNENAQTDTDLIQSKLVILGMVGISDPIRDAVPLAVKQCNEASVRVRMITGDNP